MFIALVLASRWVLARGLASAREHIDAARRHSTISALRLVAFPSSLATEAVHAEQLKIGDRVLVPPGETVPADGVVVHGRSSCSQAWLTGESTPVDKTSGAPILAGSINLDQPLVVEVTAHRRVDLARRPAAAGRRGGPGTAAHRRERQPDRRLVPVGRARHHGRHGGRLVVRRSVAGAARTPSRCSSPRARARCRWRLPRRSRRRSRRSRSGASCWRAPLPSRRWRGSTCSPATRRER